MHSDVLGGSLGTACTPHPALPAALLWGRRLKVSKPHFSYGQQEDRNPQEYGETAKKGVEHPAMSRWSAYGPLKNCSVDVAPSGGRGGQGSSTSVRWEETLWQGGREGRALEWVCPWCCPWQRQSHGMQGKLLGLARPWAATKPRLNLGLREGDCALGSLHTADK